MSTEQNLLLQFRPSELFLLQQIRPVLGQRRWCRVEKGRSIDQADDAHGQTDSLCILDEESEGDE